MNKLSLFFLFFSSMPVSVYGMALLNAVRAEDEQGVAGVLEYAKQRSIERNALNILLEKRTLTGDTALLLAATGLKQTTEDPYFHDTCLNIMAKLIMAGARVNVRSQCNGKTPLHYAADRGSLGAVNLLLMAGANQNWNDGWSTPLESISGDRMYYHHMTTAHDEIRELLATFQAEQDRLD